VPNYFFVSTAVAKSMPHLVESAIIQCYHSHNPGELSQSWNGKGSGVDWLLGPSRHSTGAARSLTVSSVVLSAMMYFGSRSITIQRAVIHMVQPIGVVAIFAIASILTSYPLYSLLLTPLVAYAAYKIWQDRRNANEERINHSKSQINVWPDQAAKAKAEASVVPSPPDLQVISRQSSAVKELAMEKVEHLIPVLGSQENADLTERSAAVAPDTRSVAERASHPHPHRALVSSQSDVGALLTFGPVDGPSKGTRRKSRGLSMSSDDMDIYYGRLDLPVRRISRTRANHQASDSLDANKAEEASVADLLSRWADRHDSGDDKGAESSRSKSRCRSLSSDDMEIEYYKDRFKPATAKLAMTAVDRDGEEEEEEEGWEYQETDEDEMWRVGFRRDVDLWVEDLADNMSDAAEAMSDTDEGAAAQK
jgi:hypothetical protein